MHWIFLIVLLLVLLQRALFVRMGMKFVTYERILNKDSCVEGEEIQMIEKVTNAKWLPVPWLRMEAAIPSQLVFSGGKEIELEVMAGTLTQTHSSLFSLFPNTRVTRRHRFTCHQRGVYILKSATMSFGDLLGMARRYQTYWTNLRLLVYPEPVPWEDIPYPVRQWMGETEVRRWMIPDPFLFAGVRSYQAGDSLHEVNWKASARAGALQVHQKGHSADYSVMVLLNVEDREDIWKHVIQTEMIEYGIKACSTIMHQLHQRQLPFGFASNGYELEDKLKAPVYIARSSGMEPFLRTQEALARLKIESAVPFHDLLAQVADKESVQTDCLILTAVLTEKVSMQIDRLRQQGRQVMVYDLSAFSAQGEKVS
ncbi:DUF58 domain-containing protein [Marinicrinis sediminis]|uniref:DUF58 domain-containing protein n=1 Tax=Marinicrinis sediminis TaxID=1652465 RepID=A0ABW5R5V4_9BACL